MLLFAPPHGSLRPLGACWGAHQRPCGQRLSGPNRLVLTPARAAPSSRQPCGLRVLAAAAAPGEDLRAPPAAAAAPAASTGGAAERAPSQPNKGTLFGAIALITGSTVGAGMLALPAVSAPAGIIPTSTTLLGMWAVLTLDALLICEVNLAARAAREAKGGSRGSSSSSSSSSGSDSSSSSSSDSGGGGGEGGIVTLRQMAEFSLGKSAGKGFTLIYLCLAYSLLTAYCTKAAEVLDFFAGGGLPPVAASATFAGAIGGLLFLGGPRTIDAINQSLTSVLLLLFGAILAAGASQAGLPAALLSGAADWGALEPAVPIIFLALVYHDLIPVIVSYLGGDRAAIRSAICLGSLVPLAMFLSWEAVALSLLPAGLGESAAAAAVGGAPLMQASLQLAAADAGATLPAAAAAGVDAAAAAMPVAELADGPAALAVDPLQVFVRRSGPLVGRLVEGFSFLAVATSFIGTTLSLSETLRTEVPPLLREATRQLRRATGGDAAASTDMSDDELACLLPAGPLNVNGCSANWEASRGGAVGGDGAEEGPSGSGDWAAGDQRGLALLLTLCPPLALAASNPDNFLGALEFAGAYFMTLLYGVLPPVMAWQLRAKVQAKRQQQVAPPQPPQPQPQSPASAAEAAVERLQQQWPPAGPAEPAPGAGRRPELPWWRQQHDEMVPGGAPVLAGLFVAAVAVIQQRILADTGLSSAAAGEASGYVQGFIEAALHSPGGVPEAVLALLQGAAPL